jgi:uncharacterized protein (DUF433 family)
MTMADTILAIEHIVKTPGVLGGDPRIAGHRIGVHDIVVTHLINELPLEEVARRYRLTLAEVYAAMAYYYDHQAEIDAIIAANEEAIDRVQAPSEQERAKFEALHQHNSAPETEMTAAEIAAEFGISTQAIRKAAMQHRIKARKSGTTWLIKRRDALARWGKHSPR